MKTKVSEYINGKTYIFENVPNNILKDVVRLKDENVKNSKQVIKQIFNIKENVYMWGVEGNTVFIVCHKK
jgi:hypothetical protein